MYIATWKHTYFVHLFGQKTIHLCSVAPWLFSDIQNAPHKFDKPQQNYFEIRSKNIGSLFLTRKNLPHSVVIAIRSHNFSGSTLTSGITHSKCSRLFFGHTLVFFQFSAENYFNISYICLLTKSEFSVIIYKNNF